MTQIFQYAATGFYEDPDSSDEMIPFDVFIKQKGHLKSSDFATMLQTLANDIHERTDFMPDTNKIIVETLVLISPKFPRN